MPRNRFSFVGFLLAASSCVALLHAACSSTVKGTVALDEPLGGAGGESSSGGSSSGGSGEGGDASGGQSTTAPTVVSFSPEDGEKGVSDDAVIVVVFSEPMNQESVEDAYVSETLPADLVTFAWNAAGDTLTITPGKDVLAYAQGETPSSVTAQKYDVAFGDGAEDLAGNALLGDATATFSTKRQFYTTLDYDTSLTHGLDSKNVDHAAFAVGDDDANTEIKFFVSYYMSQLPAGADITSVTFGVSQKLVTGDPYDGLGYFVAVPISFESISQSAMNAPPLSTQLTLSTDSLLGTKHLELGDQVQASLDSKSKYFQLRFELADGASNNATADQAVFDLLSMKLAVNYLLD